MRQEGIRRPSARRLSRLKTAATAAGRAASVTRGSVRILKGVLTPRVTNPNSTCGTLQDRLGVLSLEPKAFRVFRVLVDEEHRRHRPAEMLRPRGRCNISFESSTLKFRERSFRMTNSYGRRREEGEFLPLMYALSGHSCVSGSYGSDDPTRSAGFEWQGEERWMYDVVQRGYHRRSQRGEVIFNPMQSQKEFRFGTGADFEVKKKSNSTCWSRHKVTNGAAMHLDESTYAMAGFAPINHHQIVDLDEDSLRKIAGTQALADVNSPIFESHVFFAELRETLGMLRAPYEGYYAWLKKMERTARRKRGRKRRLEVPITLYQFISNQWLQYRYGILPVCADAEAALEALNTLEAKPGVRKTARGYQQYGGDVSNTSYSTIWYGTLDATRVEKTTRYLSCRAGILYELDSRNVWGRSWSDVPGAVWEAVPFSFVVDWWANVGDYLRAITPKVGVKELSSWTVLIDQLTTTLQCTATRSSVSPEWVYESIPSSTQVVTTTRKTRIPGINVGLAMSPFTEAFTGDVGLDRLTDLTALTAQILRVKV